MGKCIDLTGQKFGRLTVLYRIQGTRTKNGISKPVWHCKCDCGNECDVAGAHLRTGHTQSCGCLHKEILSQNNKELKGKTNIYDLSGNFGIGYTYNIDPTDILKQRNYFYFDLEDYDKIRSYCWSFDKYGYLIAYNKNNQNKKTIIKMHMVVMNYDSTENVVDHIKHKKYDNRKSELRICTYSQNMFNKMPYCNKAIITGVQFENNKFKAYLRYQGKMVLCKYFETLEEAIAVRKEAEKKYFGEYSYDNSMSMDTENKEAIDI